MQSPALGMVRSLESKETGDTSVDEDLGVLANTRLSLPPEQSQQNSSSELSTSFLAQRFAVLEAQTVSREVQMQLRAWPSCAHTRALAVSPLQ